MGWARGGLGVGLNSRGEGLWLADSKLLVWGSSTSNLESSSLAF